VSGECSCPMGSPCPWSRTSTSTGGGTAERVGGVAEPTVECRERPSNVRGFQLRCRTSTPRCRWRCQRHRGTGKRSLLRAPGTSLWRQGALLFPFPLPAPIPQCMSRRYRGRTPHPRFRCLVPSVGGRGGGGSVAIALECGGFKVGRSACVAGYLSFLQRSGDRSRGRPSWCIPPPAFWCWARHSHSPRLTSNPMKSL
jgi:hypothetical protein